MGLFFGNLFWGILFILIGLSLILKGFGLNLPLVKVFIAIIVILFGIKLLIGGSRSNVGTGFGERKESSSKVEYSTVFGSQTIDLSRGKLPNKPIEITAVFGSARVVLPSDVEFEINPTTVFGAMTLPNVEYYGFGNDTQKLNPGASKQAIPIEANCVFGKMVFTVRKTSQPAPVTPDSTETKDAPQQF